jgi:hypothetical protein
MRGVANVMGGVANVMGSVANVMGGVGVFDPLRGCLMRCGGV